MKSAKKAVVEVPWENPLIPNRRLRQLYASMAELRLLRIHLSGRRRGQVHAKAAGDEACRASTALSLLSGDLTSEPDSGIATSFLRGAKLADIATFPDRSQLPLVVDPVARLHLAIGASLVQKKGSLVLAYVHANELSLPDWRPGLRLAAMCTTPLIFVVLPDATEGPSKPGRLSAIASSAGVPGIPVDAADAVALYRVVQEAMLRARAGGGPVLMECVPFRLPGRRSPANDPVRNMRESLLQRKVADDAWFSSVERRFSARLKAAAL